MSELEIFELGLALAKALGGDKEAIADIALLYRRHPEMFENFQDVVKTIEEVIKDPEIIMKAKTEGALLAIKELDGNKMGEIAIQNDNGTNVVFHTNKKRIKELEKIKQSLVETPTPSTHRSKSAGELMKEKILSSGTNAHSMIATENILPQTDKSQEAQKEQRSSASQIQKPKYKEEDTNTLNSTKRRKR
ncbi:hypothetical protein [Helicobacter cappadocius]|uniref:Uncharacterized protein n=1 Tax=Helicobacter cappadocius TaxID=3063998 RepID=A0AA90PJS8_9HELI|nr:MULTISPECIES: hypothetical protein [unclassified Helicobacter]MDO7253074.1 hypothetical protein [Helicobacter sp. faydin-H75]MDP2538800.1 hypothetical protein [Helicobacter sp. faydin-H76]